MPGHYLTTRSQEAASGLFSLDQGALSHSHKKVKIFAAFLALQICMNAGAHRLHRHERSTTFQVDPSAAVQAATHFGF